VLHLAASLQNRVQQLIVIVRWWRCSRSGFVVVQWSTSDEVGSTFKWRQRFTFGYTEEHPGLFDDVDLLNWIVVPVMLDYCLVDKLILKWAALSGMLSLKSRFGISRGLCRRQQAALCLLHSLGGPWWDLGARYRWRPVLKPWKLSSLRLTRPLSYNMGVGLRDGLKFELLPHIVWGTVSVDRLELGGATQAITLASRGVGVHSGRACPLVSERGWAFDVAHLIVVIILIGVNAELRCRALPLIANF